MQKIMYPENIQRIGENPKKMWRKLQKSSDNIKGHTNVVTDMVTFVVSTFRLKICDQDMVKTHQKKLKSRLLEK